MFPADIHKGGFKTYKVSRGIYKFDDGKLFLCWTKAGVGRRPLDFKSTDKGQEVLVVLEKKE